MPKTRFGITMQKAAVSSRQKMKSDLAKLGAVPQNLLDDVFTKVVKNFPCNIYDLADIEAKAGKEAYFRQSLRGQGQTTAAFHQTESRTARQDDRNVRNTESLSKGLVIGFQKLTSEPLSYSVFKAEIEAVRDELKREIRDQHDQTRNEIRVSRAELLNAIQRSPVEFVKLSCETVALLCCVFLAIRFFLKIELVNPIFATFMIFACSVYWGMALVKQQRDRRAGGRS